MIGYLVLALVFVLAVAGAGFQGFRLGGDHKQVEWDRANAVAAAQVEADRKAQDEKARKLASRLSAKIATQDATNREIASALDKALQAKPIPASCAIDDSLRELWNRANSGAGEAAGVVPGASVKPPAS